MLRIVFLATLLQFQPALADEPALARPADMPGKPVAASAPGSADAALHWYDGGRRRGLLVDDRLRVDFIDGKAVLSDQPARAGKALDAATTAGAPADSTVFRDADSPAVKRALPGGVIITTHAPTDAASLDRLLAARGLAVARQLDASGTRWLVETPSGIAALELANRLHESGDFAAVAPNWWRERALK